MRFKRFIWNALAGFLMAVGVWAIVTEEGQEALWSPEELQQETTQSGEAHVASSSVGTQTLDASSLTDENAASPQKDPDLEVHFIDVGQGDATLIKCGETAMLIDTGPDGVGTALWSYMRKQGVEQLSYLVLTHPDADHIGSASVIINKFEIETLLMPDYEKDNRIYDSLLEAMEYKRLQAVLPQVGEVYSLGGAKFTVIAPNAVYEDPNNSSIGLLLEYGETSFLFTGDAEGAAEADILGNGIPIQADVYKVAHHGSKTSSGVEFLDVVQPEYAIISCGENNDYGHPHSATLNALRQRGIKVFRTDEQGTVVVFSDGENITWNCAPSESWQTGS